MYPCDAKIGPPYHTNTQWVHVMLFLVWCSNDFLNGVILFYLQLLNA